MAGWYNEPSVGAANTDFGVTNQDFDSDTFREGFVPSGWRHDPSDNMPPAGSEQLFSEAVSENCIVCHARRGTTLGSDTAVNGSKDIDFSSYEKFISYAGQIEQYVYERGVMPLSLRGFEAFWSSDAPEILATHLDDFDRFGEDGSVLPPGRPVADAGPDRTAASPVRLFGGNSRFNTTWSWQIVSVPAGGGGAALSAVDSVSPRLTANQPGDYVVRLSVNNGMGEVDSDTVTITVDSGLDPAALTFDADIRPVLQSDPPGPDCDSCHQQLGTGAIAGVRVFWTDDQPVGGTTLYQEVLARIDFNNPQNSLLLTKPSGNHHYGGLRAGFEVDNPSNRFNYDLFLNWILEGAREN
jgi:hypothetical protein